VVVREEEVLPLRNPDPDCSVVLYDPTVMRLWERGEELVEMFAIIPEFGSSVGEDIFCRFCRTTPGDDPFAMGVHRFGRFRCSEREFDIPNFLCAFLVMADRVHIGKDAIKVDRSAREQVAPFCIRELWASGGVEERGLGDFWVSSDILESRDGFPKRFREVDWIDLILEDPWERPEVNSRPGRPIVIRLRRDAPGSLMRSRSGIVVCR
jgi:hypothetical protein